MPTLQHSFNELQPLASAQVYFVGAGGRAMAFSPPLTRGPTLAVDLGRPMKEVVASCFRAALEPDLHIGEAVSTPRSDLRILTSGREHDPNGFDDAPQSSSEP